MKRYNSWTAKGVFLFCVAMSVASTSLAADWVPAPKVDIPAAYIGKWALDAKFCAEGGPAVVEIEPRAIHFFERHAYLELAQLNEIAPVPVFYGKFDIVENLQFSSEPIRLAMVGRRLAITEGAKPDTPNNPITWTRCSSAN